MIISIVHEVKSNCFTGISSAYKTDFGTEPKSGKHLDMTIKITLPALFHILC